MGVFTSRDPFRGVMERSASRNGHSWVEGRVVNAVDPSGMCGLVLAARSSNECYTGFGASGGGSTTMKLPLWELPALNLPNINLNIRLPNISFGFGSPTIQTIPGTTVFSPPAWLISLDLACQLDYYSADQLMLYFSASSDGGASTGGFMDPGGSANNGDPNDRDNWDVGDPIDKDNPDWSTARERYWRNRSHEAEAGEFSASNMGRMRNGKGPVARIVARIKGTGELQEMVVTRELHHIGGRAIENPHASSNLMELWPWEHAIIDPNRYINYEFVRFK